VEEEGATKWRRKERPSGGGRSDQVEEEGSLVSEPGRSNGERDGSEIVVAFVHAFIVNRVLFNVDLSLRFHVREC
jgi:hypothetical protein